MSSLAGTFLVAKPILKDGFFSRSVILILQHGPDGAFGLVLNKPSPKEDVAVRLHVGGPCKFHGLIMIHGEEDWVEEEERETSQICPGVYLGDAACMKRITDPPPDNTWRFRVFAGYSGWAPGQLEQELLEGSWHVVSARGSAIFDIADDEMWVNLVPSSIPEPSLN